MGLLDRTHLRFFDREGVVDLFASAGFAAEEILRVTRPLEETEFEVDPETIPSDVLAAATAGADATTYQFIVIATPSASAPLEATRGLLRQPRSPSDCKPNAIFSSNKSPKVRNTPSRWKNSAPPCSPTGALEERPDGQGCVHRGTAAAAGGVPKHRGALEERPDGQGGASWRRSSAHVVPCCRPDGSRRPPYSRRTLVREKAARRVETASRLSWGRLRGGSASRSPDRLLLRRRHCSR